VDRVQCNKYYGEKGTRDHYLSSGKKALSFFFPALNLLTVIDYSSFISSNQLVLNNKREEASFAAGEGYTYGFCKLEENTLYDDDDALRPEQK
jgi:hypothetical protein